MRAILSLNTISNRLIAARYGREILRRVPLSMVNHHSFLSAFRTTESTLSPAASTEGRKICEAKIHGTIAISYEEWYKNSSICERRTNRTLSYYIRTQVSDEN